MKLPGLPIVLLIGGCALTYGLAHGQSKVQMLDAQPDAALIGVQMIAQAPMAPAPAVAPVESVDETALRYFARIGDQRRVDAEMARLRALYPAWEPPANLLSDDYVPDADIVRIWDLFTAGDYAGARVAIADKQAADPGFTPSDDLLASLRLGEAGLRLRTASDAGTYESVVTIAANEPGLLTCASVDNLWRLAEAFIKTDKQQRGLDAYGYILRTCTDPAERLATMQKAMVLVDRAALDPLLALEKTNVDGVGEFMPLRLDLARSAIGEVLAGTARQAPPADVSLLGDSARLTKAPEDLRLLGYYALNRKRSAEGRDWFEMAMDADPSELSASGLAVALLDLRRPSEAEAVLADYADASEDLTALYLTAAAATLAQEPRVSLEPDVLGRIVDNATANNSAAVAQEIGWYAYAFQQPTTAVAWFRLAMGWDPDNEPAAYGMVVASDALKDAATVRSVQQVWSARSARIANFGKAATSQTAAPSVASAPADPAVVQIAYTSDALPSAGGGGCAGFVPPESLSPGQALTRAWCLMDLLRPADAAANFERALQASNARTRSDAAYGQSLAYIRLGLANDAAVAAAAAPQTADRVLQLQIDIATQTALRAYDIGDYRTALIALDERARYAPEQNDLLTLRAWSYFHLNRRREARQIFVAVAATGYAPAVEGVTAVTQLSNL